VLCCIVNAAQNDPFAVSGLSSMKSPINVRSTQHINELIEIVYGLILSAFYTPCLDLYVFLRTILSKTIYL